MQLALHSTAVAGLAEILPPLAFADSVPVERASGNLSQAIQGIENFSTPAPLSRWT
jgi:hypothetical protein